MIKKILLAALVVISTNYISAQAKIGLKGGLGFANAKYTSGTYSETYNSIVTPNFGLTLDFKGSESFNIQSGLMYNGMGGKYSYDGGSTRTHLNYLSIPLLAKFKFGEGFHGYAGPQLSFLLSAKYKDEDGNAIDLTGASAKMQVRDVKGGTKLAVTLTSPSGGIVIAGSLGKLTITLTPTQTNKLFYPKSVYDIMVVDSNANKIKLLEGFITLNRSVTI